MSAPDLLQALEVVTQLGVQGAGRQLREPPVPEVLLPAGPQTREFQQDLMLTNRPLHVPARRRPQHKILHGRRESQVTAALMNAAALVHHPRRTADADNGCPCAMTHHEQDGS